MRYLNNYTEHLNEENNFEEGLTDNNIDSYKEKIKIKKLKIGQKEIYLDQVVDHMIKNSIFVEETLNGKIKDRKILISSDNFIIDGNHRLAVAFILNPKCKIKCTKINVGFDESIDIFKKIDIDDDHKDGNSKYNIFNLIKLDRDKLKDILKDIFSKQDKKKVSELMDEIENKTKSDLHPLNYMIRNIYKMPLPDNDSHDRSDSPQMNDKEIDEILNF